MKRNDDTPIERRTYGLTNPHIVFPIRRSQPWEWKALGFSTVVADYLDRNVMDLACWFDGEVIHNCYRCERCKTHFFGTELEDFSHECNDESIKDVVTYRCGHSEKGFPSASEAEREYKQRTARHFLCMGCELGKFRERKKENNAK